MSEPQRLPPEALDDWLAAAAGELGLDRGEVPIAAILDVAAVVAHGVARPAAPLSTFLLGLAYGRGSLGDASLDELVSRLAERARAWDAAEE